MQALLAESMFVAPFTRLTATKLCRRYLCSLCKTQRGHCESVLRGIQLVQLQGAQSAKGQTVSGKWPANVRVDRPWTVLLTVITCNTLTTRICANFVVIDTVLTSQILKFRSLGSAVGTNHNVRCIGLFTDRHSMSPCHSPGVASS